jgi:two-component system, OmpR family, sensor kinase
MTLRRRVVAALIGLSLLVFAIGSLSTIAIRRHLLSRIDQTLLVGPFENAQVPSLARVRRVDVCQFPQVADAVIIFAGTDGRLTSACPAGAIPEINVSLLEFGSSGTTQPITATDESGTQYRMRFRRLPDGDFVGFGLSLTDTNRTLRRVALIQIVAGLCVLFGLGLVARWLLRRGLAPLDRIATSADLIAASDRTHRVDLGGHANDEVGRVGRALNGMLDELDKSLAEVTASRDERERAEQRLRQFVQDASHELRTPLTSIRGYTELFERGALPPGFDVGDAMGRIGSEADRMARLVNDMLRLAQLDAEPRLTLSRVDVGQLVERVAVDAHATDGRWPVTVDVPPDGQPVTATIDPEAIHQVLTNLLDNVRAHTPPGTRVTLGLARENGSHGGVRLSVRDAGPGIDEAVLPEVFERFVRADPARNHARGSSGLGLSIVKSIVTAHGGTVSAQNIPAGGAEFIVSLPAT